MSLDSLKGTTPSINTLIQRAQRNNLDIPEEFSEPDGYWRRNKGKYLMEFVCSPYVPSDYTARFMRYFNAIAEQIRRIRRRDTNLFAEALCSDGVAVLHAHIGDDKIIVEVRGSWRNDEGQVCLNVYVNGVESTLSKLHLLRRIAIGIWLRYATNNRFNKLVRLRAHREWYNPTRAARLARWILGDNLRLANRFE